MSYMDRIKECNNYREDDKTPFMLDGKRVGQIRETYKKYILDSGIFVLEDNAITLIADLKTFNERTEALKIFAQQVYKDKISNRFMDENYPIIASFTSEPLAFVDRSISSLLGLMSFGQHLNAYVMTDSGMKMWIARRAFDRGYEAGKLDHMVAGGLAYDVSPHENLLKECYEEAGMSEELASKAKPVGFVTYKYDYTLGGKDDILYCYDIELDESFTPVCTDGEVEEFYLMPIKEVAKIVETTNDFKVNCNLVIIDFLVRHGYLSSEDKDYIGIVNGLRV
jgi:8-oxo-dGTP pyrophosphatase MutT (NUDIX family)